MSVKLLTEHNLEFSKLKRGLHRLVWVYTCQNATLLEITCGGSISSLYCKQYGPGLDCSLGSILLLLIRCCWFCVSTMFRCALLFCNHPGKRAKLLYFSLPTVLWLLLFCGSSSRCCGLVCSMCLWYLLIILTCLFHSICFRVKVVWGTFKLGPEQVPNMGPHWNLNLTRNCIIFEHIMQQM